MITPDPPTVLFCPLNWGLGHITRDLPLIKAFRDVGYRVIVATDAPLDQWLKRELPNLETAHFAGPKIRYSRFPWQWPTLLMQLPRLAGWIHLEKKRVQQLVNRYHPCLIISDNRYGARSDSVLSVIITHQLMIKLPRPLQGMETLLHRFISQLINRFNQCWVPDFSKEFSLAGDLVHKYPLPANVRLIGPLSRFDDDHFGSEITPFPLTQEVLAIISGPEPQRTILEKEIKQNLENHGIDGTIITGRPDASPETWQEPSSRGVTLLPHLSTPEMAQMIKSHQTVVCRSGYSTLMDLYFLKTRAWLIATPGQTEQEYLADYHNNKGHRKLAQQHIKKQQFAPPTPGKTSFFPTPPQEENFRQILSEFFVRPPKKDF